MNCVFVEIPKDSPYKIEKTKQIFLDRVLKIPCVQNYGYIVDSTIQPDGDLADCFIITNTPLSTGLQIEMKNLDLLAIIRYIDSGERDDKYVFGIKGVDFNFTYEILKIINWLTVYKNNTNYIEKIYLKEPLEGSNSKLYDPYVVVTDLDSVHTNYFLKL